LPVVTVCFCIFSCICSTFYETHIPHHAYLSWILCMSLHHDIYQGLQCVTVL
jgi:hypothetical protein